MVQTSLDTITPALRNSLRLTTASPGFPAGDGITAVAAMGLPSTAKRGTPPTSTTDAARHNDDAAMAAWKNSLRFGVA